MSIKTLILVCGATAASLALSSAPSYARISQEASRLEFLEDTATVIKPLKKKHVDRCGLTLRYPALVNFFDQEIGPGCAGSYKEGSTTLSMGYQYGAFPNERSKAIDINIAPVRLEEWLSAARVAQPRSSTFNKTDTAVELKADAGFGNICSNLINIKITPIQGSNWHGWMAEQIYGPTRNRKSYCQVYSPKYRCIELVIGNKKMSAELGGACLLRKRTTSLEEGLNYDLFMEMIKSINFNEE
jgi:hypothetical protein